jgi:hypothetical protein
VTVWTGTGEGAGELQLVTGKAKFMLAGIFEAGTVITGLWING